LFIAQWTSAAEAIWGAMEQTKNWDWKPPKDDTSQLFELAIEKKISIN